MPFRYKFKRQENDLASFSIYDKLLIVTSKLVRKDKTISTFSRATCTQVTICTMPYIRGTSLRPDPFIYYTILNEHALYCLVFCVRTLLVNTPFYPSVCVQIHDHLRARVWLLRDERKGHTATVLTSVQGGTWPLAVGAAGRWGWFGSKGRACFSTFFYLRLYSSPFRRDTVFVL